MMEMPLQRCVGITVSQAPPSTVTSISTHSAAEGLIVLIGFLLVRMSKDFLSALKHLKLQKELSPIASALVEIMGFGMNGLPKAS